MDTPGDALDVYEKTKSFRGGTSTRLIIEEQFDISLNDPMSEHTPNLVRGTKKNTNEPIIVKYLADEQSLHVHTLVKERLNGVPNLVQFDIITLRTDEPAVALRKVQHAIWMERFPCTAWDLTTTTDGAIALGVRSVVDCLQEMHRRHFVHMDVKPENIFVNGRGVFLLGDFDATHFVGDAVSRYIRTTKAYLPADMQNPTVSFAVDWEMLLTTIAVFMKKNRGEELPFAPQRVDRDAILKATNDESLAAVVCRIEDLLCFP